MHYFLHMRPMFQNLSLTGKTTRPKIDKNRIMYKYNIQMLNNVEFRYIFKIISSKYYIQKYDRVNYKIMN